MPDYPPPSKEEFRQTYKGRRNWGRWGDDDQLGAINLITPEKRQEALALATSGRTVSLSRPYPKTPGPLNPGPAQHFMRWQTGPSGFGGAADYYGFIYHGYSFTHIDALCHVWDEDGGWQGRTPEQMMDTGGAKFGDVFAWRGGIVTRGVLLDVPRFRGEPFVSIDKPVMGAELADIATAQGVEVRAGDALLVYSGREKFQATNPDKYLGSPPTPGLHASCGAFIRDTDVALLGWDMLDAQPGDYGSTLPVHGVLYNFGVALLDNALLEPLADACAEEGRYEFMLIVLPLPVQGGTGSPVNPLAIF